MPRIYDVLIIEEYKSHIHTSAMAPCMLGEDSGLSYILITLEGSTLSPWGGGCRLMGEELGVFSSCSSSGLLSLGNR